MKNLTKRTALFALDATFATAMVACAWFALSMPALAYVDPSVMTYTIQALAGVAVALSAVLGVAWRRIRRWFFKALHIDENAGKIVEPVVTRARKSGAHFAANVAGAGATGAGASASVLQAANEQARSERAQQGVAKPLNLNWGARFVLALLAAVAFCFSQMVAAPLEIIATNASAFSFSFTSVWQPLAIFAAVCALVLALLVSLTRGRAFDVVLGIVVAITLAALLQALFFNKYIPSANGAKIDIMGAYKGPTLYSLIMWFVVIAGVIVLAVKQSVAIKGFAALACIALILTSGISMGTSLYANADSFNTPKPTKEGLFTVSNKKNVIIFILDYFDNSTMDETLEKYPEALASFDGFTRFHNSTSMSIPTAYGVPFLVTGNFIDTNDTTTISTNSEKVQSWFSEHNLLDDANAQGYTVGVYSDSVNEGCDTSEAPLVDEAFNVHTTGDVKVNSWTQIVPMLLKCSAFRDAPWILKPFVRYYTGDINNAIVSTDGTDAADTPYLLDDPRYYEELCDTGLSIDETGEGAYRVIHLMGGHNPYTMDENAQDIPDDAVENTTEARDNQAAGALKIVSEYFSQLKELGLYDDATIIVTSDHGNYNWRKLPEFATTPILMVKPSGSSGAAIQTSEVPTGHMDLPATIREALGISVDAPTVFEVTDENRTRYFYWQEEHSSDEGGEIGFREIEINGNALDFNNWSVTGRFWPNGEENAGVTAPDTLTAATTAASK